MSGTIVPELICWLIFSEYYEIASFGLLLKKIEAIFLF